MMSFAGTRSVKSMRLNKMRLFLSLIVHAFESNDEGFHRRDENENFWGHWPAGCCVRVKLFHHLRTIAIPCICDVLHMSCLAPFDSFRFALVVVDVTLPGMNRTVVYGEMT